MPAPAAEHIALPAFDRLPAHTGRTEHVAHNAETARPTRRHPARRRIPGVLEFAPTGSAGCLLDRYLDRYGLSRPASPTPYATS